MQQEVLYWHLLHLWAAAMFDEHKLLAQRPSASMLVPLPLQSEAATHINIKLSL
jgi:hypothetical protein